MGLNGANGSGRSVEEETDKKRKGTRCVIMQCGTRREAVWQRRCTACKCYFLPIQYLRDILENAKNKKLFCICSHSVYHFRGYISPQQNVCETSLVCAPAVLISQPGRIVKWKWSTRGVGLRSSLYYEVQRYENTWDTVRRQCWTRRGESGRRNGQSRFEGAIHYSSL